MSRRKGLQVSMPPAFATADSMATLSAVSALQVRRAPSSDPRTQRLAPFAHSHHHLLGSQELSCSPHRIHMPANFVDCIMSENNCPLQLQAAGSGHHGGISTESISSDCSTAVSFPLSSSLSPASSGASPRALQAMYRPTLISGKVMIRRFWCRSKGPHACVSFMNRILIAGWLSAWSEAHCDRLHG